MGELPDGWVELKSGKTFKQISTTHKKVKTKECFDTGLYPVIDQGQKKVAGYVDDKSKVIEVINPVCIFGDHTRIIKWVEENFVPGADGTKVIEAKNFLLPRYFYYQLRELKLPDKGYSRHFQFLKESLFRIAPLNEQIRIANKLDSLLAKVEAAQTRLDKIPTLLKRFRQAVLAAATSGELTREWRTNIGIHPDWKSLSLIDVVETKPRNGKSPKGVDYETNIKNMTLSAVTPGYFVEGTFKYVDIDVSDDSYLWVKNGDILIQRANTIEYVGISALYLGEDNKYVYPDLIMKCRANERILSHYLHYPLLAETTRKYFRENATGTAGNMPKINQKIVCSTPIMLPSHEEQKQIVRRVEALFALADSVEKQYLQACSRLKPLLQSILAKGFRGELVPQDPNDEPAEQLLARIQAEREKQTPAQKPRKTKKSS